MIQQLQPEPQVAYKQAWELEITQKKTTYEYARLAGIGHRVLQVALPPETSFRL